MPNRTYSRSNTVVSARAVMTTATAVIWGPSVAASSDALKTQPVILANGSKLTEYWKVPGQVYYEGPKAAIVDPERQTTIHIQSECM